MTAMMIKITRLAKNAMDRPIPTQPQIFPALAIPSEEGAAMPESIWARAFLAKTTASMPHTSDGIP